MYKPKIIIYHDEEPFEYMGSFVVFQKKEDSLIMIEFENTESRQGPFIHTFIRPEPLRTFPINGKDASYIERLIESMRRRCKKQGKNLLETNEIYPIDDIVMKHMKNYRRKDFDSALKYYATAG